MSPTRKNVAELTKRGLSVRQIALKLQISTQAVYKHKAALANGTKRSA